MQVKIYPNSKMKFQFLIALGVAALAISTPAAVLAQSPSPSAKAVGFHGKVISVDIFTKTFLVGKRTFHVTGQTTITNGDKAGTVADIVPVEEVSGSYWKKADGSLEVKTIKIVAKTADEPSDAAAEKKQRAEAPTPTLSPK
jgi:hypothetical protein